MEKDKWLESVDEKEPVVLSTCGGYTYEQVMWSRNTSKDPKYWYRIINSDKFLFRSDVAESWEFHLPNYKNPIRNMQQVYLYFKDSSVFLPSQLNFTKNGVYTTAKKGSPLYELFWDQEEKRCDIGYEVEGVRISGRHYFMLNYGRMRARYRKADGTLSERKKSTFPGFVDFQYYLANEVEWWYLDYLYTSEKLYFEWFPLATAEDFESKKKQGAAVPKARRKGLTYFNSNAINAYNYVFIPDSYNIVGAYQESFYGVLLNEGIKPAIHWINEHTPWQRRSKVLNRSDNFKASYMDINEYGIPVERGYKSQISCITFNSTAFAGIGRAADSLSIEEAGKFNNLLDVWSISIEPLIKDGDVNIGSCIIFGCVCAGTKVWNRHGELKNIEDIKQYDGIVGYAEKGPTLEPITWIQEPKNKRCLRITGTNGFSIECSHDHPLLWSRRKYNKEVKENGTRKSYQKVTFKRVEDMQEGDYLMLAPNVPIFGKETLNNARLIGLMIGDGNYSKNSTPTLSVGDEEIYDYVNEIGYGGAVHKEFTTKNGSTYRQVAVGDLRNQLKELGIYGQVKQNKRLPDCWDKLEKNSLAELVSGYFDADGSVQYNEKKDYTRIRLTSAVFPLLEQVKYALEKFNVYSYITKEKRSGGYKESKGYYYNLVIDRNKEILEFRKHFSFLCKHKQDRLDAVKEKSRHFGYYKKAYFELNPDNNKGIEYYPTHPWFEDLRHTRITKIEDIGEQPVYNLSAGKTHGYIANSCVSSQTAGEMEGAGGSLALSQIAYNPDAMGLVSYANIYDEVELGESSIFIDALWFFPTKIKKEELLELTTDPEYKIYIEGLKGKYVDAVDEQGNSHRLIAELVIHKNRKRIRKAGTSAYNNYLTQYPIYLAEAFLVNEVSPFDKALVREAKAELATSDKKIETGYFSENSNNEVIWNIDFDKQPISKYPHDSDQEEGCWMLFERPVPNLEHNSSIRYIAGMDPIDSGYEEKNSDNKHSLASTYIMDTLTGNLVAAYTGRPARAYQYYREVVRGLRFYGARVMYENNLAGFYQYCHNNKFLNILADEPTILKGKVGYKMGRVGTKGFHATEEVNRALRESVAVWLEEDVHCGQNLETGEPIYKKRYFTIEDMGLLEEIEKWTAQGNFDRISALMALILYYEQTANARAHQIKLATTKKSKLFTKFERKYFGNEL